MLRPARSRSCPPDEPPRSLREPLRPSCARLPGADRRDANDAPARPPRQAPGSTVLSRSSGRGRRPAAGRVNMGTSAIAGLGMIEQMLALQPDMGTARNAILFVADGNGVGTGCAPRPVMGQQAGVLGEDVVLPIKTFPSVALVKTASTKVERHGCRDQDPQRRQQPARRSRLRGPPNVMVAAPSGLPRSQDLGDGPGTRCGSTSAAAHALGGPSRARAAWLARSPHLPPPVRVPPMAGPLRVPRREPRPRLALSARPLAPRRTDAGRPLRL